MKIYKEGKTGSLHKDIFTHELTSSFLPIKMYVQPMV